MAALQPLDDVVGDATGTAEGAPADGATAAGTTAARTGRRPRGRRLGVAFWLAVAWLVLVLLAAPTAEWLPLADPYLPDVPANLRAPTADHPLGPARLVHGARVSVTVSLSAVGIGMLVGGVLGTAVGYLRGLFETVVMAVVDVMLAFPSLVLLLAVLAYVGRSLTVISLLIGVLSIPVYTRVARANTLAVAQREFVLAAHTLGATRRRILFREIVPNVVLPVLAFGLVAMGVVIVLEGS